MYRSLPQTELIQQQITTHLQKKVPRLHQTAVMTVCSKEFSYPLLLITTPLHLHTVTADCAELLPQLRPLTSNVRLRQWSATVS